MDNISNIEGVIKGIDKVTEIIRPTYGHAGQNVVIEEMVTPFYRVTNDCKTIVDAIKLYDKSERVGKNIMAESTDAAEVDSQDGRKTTMLLTQAIIKEGKKIQGIHPMALKKEIDSCLPLIFDSINSEKKEIKIEDVSQVASIASEDKETGKLLAEIYQKVGREGIIEIEMSQLPQSFYEITEGARFRCGFFGKYCITQEGEEKAVYQTPKILVIKDRVTSIEHLENLFQKIVKEGLKNELVIFCQDIDLPVANRLAITAYQGSFKTIIIKAPTLWSDWAFEDFAVLTGSKLIDPKNGGSLATTTVEDLGTCDKIIVYEKETRIISDKDISSHIEKIKELGKTNDQQLLRIGWLQSRIAILKVGANSSTEMNYKLKKTRDGRGSAYLALKDGVVKGAGLSLVNASEKMPDTIGGRIMREVLKVPYTQITTNSGSTDIDDSVVDAALVVKNAVENAIGIASICLTGGTVLSLVKDDKMD